MGDLIRFAFTPFNNSHPDSYLIMKTLIYFDGYYPLSYQQKLYQIII